MKPGEPWGEPTDEVATLTGAGDDRALARLVAAAPHTSPLVAFTSHGSDLARAVGIADGVVPGMRPMRLALPVDAMTLDIESSGRGSAETVTTETVTTETVTAETVTTETLTSEVLAVNMIVSGTVPTRLAPWHRRRPVSVTVDGTPLPVGSATTVVVANGQFLDGVDLVPRGHPGDGRLEVHVYALTPGERGAMRRRLPSGTHLPHPRIVTARARRVEIRWEHPRALSCDGATDRAARTVVVGIAPAAYRLLV